MDTTPVWIPLATAGAALLGGGVGAALQGTFGVRGWRRQTRLEAYSKFLDASHQFHNSVLRAFGDYGTESFHESWRDLLEAELMLGRAGSLVGIAGPASSSEAAQDVIDRCREIMADGYDPAAMAKATEDLRKAGQYGKLVEWIAETERFTEGARGVLKTQN
jgi:hypothetical protein